MCRSLLLFFFLMVRRPPRSTRTETLFPYTTRFRSTPLTFIDGVRIGGYDDLRRHFGLKVADPDATSYTPVIALFAMTALTALAAGFAVDGEDRKSTRLNASH